MGDREPTSTTSVYYDNEVNGIKIKENKPVRLERRLGLWNGVAIIIGVIVGSGIFISPTSVLSAAGTPGASLLVWGVCGLLTLMGALCMAELGTSIGDSGGDYSYIKLAYGPCLSFLYLWVTMLIILPCSNAVAALTFANYVLKPLYACEPPSEAIRLLALVIVLFLVWINCYSVGLSIKLQNSFTLSKVLALLLIISAGTYHIMAGSTNWDLDKFWPDQSIQVTGIANAFYFGLYSYGGWNALNFVTEEIENPIKNMPRAIIISITSVTIIYVLVNLSYFAVLTLPEISQSQALAVTFGQKTLGYASFLMPLSVALSTTSGLNALIFSSSRILFVGARQGQLYSLLNMISVKRLTPIPSLLVVGLTSIIYLVSTHIASLVNYLIFIEASFQVLAVSTLLVLRHKYPNLPRPLKVNTFIPYVFLILSSILIILPVYNDPTGALIGTLILLAGLPVYYLTTVRQTQSESYNKFTRNINYLAQVLTLSVQPDEELAQEFEKMN